MQPSISLLSNVTYDYNNIVSEIIIDTLTVNKKYK